MELNKLIEDVRAIISDNIYRNNVCVNGDLLVKFLLNTKLKNKLNGELLPTVNLYGAVGLQNVKSKKILYVVNGEQIYFNGEYLDCNQIEFDHCLLDLIFLV